MQQCLCSPMLIFRAWATCDASDVMNFFAVSPQVSTLIFGRPVAPCDLGGPVYIDVCQDDFNLNKLCIHPVKTKCVLFGTQQRIASALLSDGPFSLFLGDKPINQAQHYKYLGVLIDANLNFKQHVDKLLVKISKRIGVLGRIRNNLTVDAANKVYQSLVLPVMDYCDVAWSSIGKVERDNSK